MVTQESAAVVHRQQASATDADASSRTRPCVGSLTGAESGFKTSEFLSVILAAMTSPKSSFAPAFYRLILCLFSTRVRSLSRILA